MYLQILSLGGKVLKSVTVRRWIDYTYINEISVVIDRRRVAEYITYQTKYFYSVGEGIFPR